MDKYWIGHLDALGKHYISIATTKRRSAELLWARLEKETVGPVTDYEGKEWSFQDFWREGGEFHDEFHTTMKRLPVCMKEAALIADWS